MHHVLRLHPDSRCVAATHVEVEVARPRAGPSGVVLYRHRQDRAMSACRPSCQPRAPTSFGSTPASRPLSALRRAPSYYEFNFAPSTQWAAYRFDELPQRDACGGRDRRASDRSAIEPRLIHIASLAGAGSPAGFTAPRLVASRPVGGDRRPERRQVLLGLGASTRQAGLPSCRLLCARIFPAVQP